jgi:HAD superfamily hydrolase (TIGR01509 family)
MKTKAIIFDFDGIITDTEPIHMDSWLCVLEPLGISFDEDEYRKNYLGLNDKDFVESVSHRHGCHLDDVQRTDLVEAKAVESLKRLEHDIPLMPGVKEFVQTVAEKYQLAICSGALKSEIDYILKRLGWIEKFRPIISAESVKKGKPDPEGYIRTIEGLSSIKGAAISAENIVAIEDSPKGVKAAKSAGIRCIAVANTYDASELFSADMVAKTISDVDMDLI